MPDPEPLTVPNGMFSMTAPPAESYAFEPMADITALEVAHCLTLHFLVQSGQPFSRGIGPYLVEHGIERHFRRTD